ncbi:MAG: oligosaccharide flippase family protein [Pyrinomonadaceae bacterium]|nr:oligosaccharide flippase family protein [Pyrinomonadaceae bacterium]
MNDNLPKEISLKTQSAWILFAKVIGFGFSFLLPLLIVRFLNQDEVGIYRQIFLIIVNANAIFTLGFGMSAYYYLPRETSRRPAVIFNTLLFNFVAGGLVCLTLFLFPSLVGNIFQSAEITRLAPKIGIVIWLWIFSSFLETVAVANQETRMATAFIILAQFTKTALMVLAVMLFANVESFIYAAIIQAVLQSAILIVYLNSRFPRFWTAFDAKFFREQLFYALPFGLSGLLWTLQTDIHNYFVGYRFSSAEFAIYAIGCFQLPLIGMLGESATAVLIPRVSKLQATGDRAEIIRLTMRAAQKLAFFYFPIYIFLMITAQTFITTLFTRDYLGSVPIFLINLTLLPIWIWVTDPIVRAYQELGRYLLLMRVFILPVMMAALYFGIQNLDLRGMILIVVVTAFAEKIIFTAIILKKLKVESHDLSELQTIGKTAAAALTAGFFTFLFYWSYAGQISLWGASWSQMIFAAPKNSVIDFLAGSLVLAVCALIFTPLYLLSASFFGIIETDEKEKVKMILRKVFRRAAAPLPLATEK